MTAPDLLRDLDGGLIGECLELVGRRDIEGADADRVFASAVWSCLVEPGDSVGGRLRRLVGPMPALRALSSHESLSRGLLADGETTLAGGDVEKALDRWKPRLSTNRIRAAFRGAGALGARLLVPGDAAWPRSLHDLGDHEPAALWVRGRLDLLATVPSVSIVGCRASTGYGDDVAADLAASLGDRGFSIVSGGAYGIDGAAHRSALASRAPTVAVLAGGADRFYPSGHTELLTRIAAAGAVVSEVPCGTAPTRWRFLQRNRIIATVAAATVVVEAGVRSGALNTAHHASEIGRPLGAVPGPISSPSSAGCHRLIRSTAAQCITGPADVFEMVDPRWQVEVGAPAPERRRSSDENRVLDALRPRAGRFEDEIVVSTGLTDREVRATLAILELSSDVEERHDGWVRLGRTRRG